jgi:hypothetical protein
MRPEVKIHSNSTQVLICVSVLGEIFVGSIDVEVIGDLHEKWDMTPEEAESYVVRHQEAFADIVWARRGHSPPSPARRTSSAANCS